MEPDPTEIAARVRAAEAYAGYDRAVLEKRSGIGRATLQRMGSPGNPRTAGLEERQRIADACNVPRVFMEEGFAALHDSDRFSELEERVRFLAEFLLENVVPTLGEDEQSRLAEQLQERGDAPAGRTRRRGNQPPLTA